MDLTISSFRYVLWLSFLFFCAGGCTVYAPMQPTMPLLRAAGQAEGTLSVQPNGRVEATAAYAPARHLLLMGGGTVCPKLGTNTFLASRQYELGGGGYLPLGESWLVNGLAGFGQAVNSRGYSDLPIVYGSTHSEYHARYGKLFAQAGAAKLLDNRSFGFTYRLTQVRFATLTDAQLGELPLDRMLRHEGLFFMRSSWGERRRGRWETLVTAGLSVSSTPRRDDGVNFPSYGAAEYQANRNLLPAFLVSIGVVYQPNWLQKTAGPR